MTRRPPHPDDSDPPGRRYSDWDCMHRLGVDGQPERSHPYPADDVVTWIPRLDYRPGQRN